MACWGANGYGQLGDGTTTDSAVPVAVTGLPPAVAIAAGYNHTCAVHADGAGALLGLERRRPAGRRHERPTARRRSPSRRWRDVTTIAGGGFHTCAASADGAVVCWGSNDSGQLGDGTTTDRSMPMPVAGVGL